MPFLEAINGFFRRASCDGKLGLDFRSEKQNTVKLKTSSYDWRKIIYLTLISCLSLQLAVLYPALADESENHCRRFFTSHVYYPPKPGLMENGYAFENILADGSTITVIDLSHYRTNSGIVNKAVTTYERIQQKIYETRLPKYQESLTPEQAAWKKAREEKLKYRSLFILNSVRALSETRPKLLGGARVVFALSQYDKLPFELDLGIDRPYPELVAAEVGRLTVDETQIESHGQASLARAVEIIKASLRAISYNSNVEVVFVHTSRVHVRLYKAMGLIPKEVIDKDLLNQIMVFTRDQLFEFLEPGALKGFGK